MNYHKGLSCVLRGIFLGCFVMASGCEKPPTRSPSVSQQEKDQLDASLIYGDDNRLENFQASPAMKTLAASTVALVRSTSLSQMAQGEIVLKGPRFGASQQLCASEPFRDETAAAFCSGSLVGTDVVITAGHCVTDVADCSRTRFVFDFLLKSVGNEKTSFSPDEVYSCGEIIRREVSSTGVDYAIIRLDRQVVGRSPLKLRTQGAVSVGDPLVVIGHPSGLPQKIAGGGTVRAVQAGFFVTNLDTYGGNSGSAVFNLNTGLIEGILVRGDTDFIRQGDCYVSNRCTETGCRGEDVTRLDALLPFIPNEVGNRESSAAQEEIFQSDLSLAIPDAPRAGVLSSLSVASAPRGREVLVKIDIVHTYRGDLLVELISPDGLVTVLHKRSGGSLDDIQGTFGGDLVSAQNLQGLSNIVQTGTWSLRVTDKARRDTGTLRSWSLVFRNGSS